MIAIPLAALLLALSAQDDPVITVPDGFVVEKIAGSPLVERPIMGCFDDQGRLYVGDSAGVNLRFEDLMKGPPHRMLRLEDTDGDGKFDKSVVVADKITFPMGALWYRGALYVCAPPSVWRFSEADGVGMFMKRHEIVTRFGSNGNAADIHGPFLAPDGWFYWTDGRHGHSIDRPDGSKMEGKAARVFRCRPDGSQVEVVCGGGMDNPVEIAFTEEGEPLVTCALFLSSPKRVDTIFHAIEGGVFPYHECVREFKRTGDLLGSVVDVGWVAPSGLMRYRSEALGAGYRDSFFSAQFNTHKVQRHRIERDGATFRGRNEEFLVSDNPDFHPTDVLEDADGSLIVIDTGGWFRIGCPTSRIDKPQIKGGIYRVRRKDAPKVKDPWGLARINHHPTIESFIAMTADPRPAVRDRYLNIAEDQFRAVSDFKCLENELILNPSAVIRRNVVWLLARIEKQEACDVARIGLIDADASVRTVAAHVLGLRKDKASVDHLIKLLADPLLHVRREGATALGRLREKKAVPALLEAIRLGADRFLEHALIYALIQIDDRDGTLAGLADTNPNVRRAALIALDQMDHGALTREQVTPQLDPSNLPLQQAALSILTTRGWSGEVIALLREWIGTEKPNAELGPIVVAFSKDAGVQDLVAKALRNPKTSLDARLALLESVARAPLDRIPATWAAELRWSLEHSDERIVRQAVAAIRAANVVDFDASLLDLAKDAARPEELRVDALLAAAPRLAKVDTAIFNFLRDCVDREKPVLLRLAAAQALGAAGLSDDQLARLAPTLATAGALELPKLLVAYERSGSAKAGKELVAQLGKSPALEALPAEALRRALKNYPEEVRLQAEPLLKRLEVDTEAQKVRLADLAGLLSGGDAARGREVFFGKRTACSTCHTVQSQGGRVGPDLSKIASIRTGRDLLESTVFPSASFARGYEPYLIKTKDGAILDGLIARETADAIYLFTADRNEKRVARGAIELLQQGRTSIMPQGLDAQLAREELRDLMAFLQSLK
jgi:putative heme-binding domain-containing protein